MKLLPALVVVLALATAASQRSTPGVATVDVAVLDASGARVEGLTIKDFSISIDGSPASPTGLSVAAPGVSVVMLIDPTTSQPLKRYEINAALTTQWYPSLKIEDRANVGVLAAPLTLSGWQPEDPRAATTARTLVERAAFEPSPLWDAALSAIDALKGERNTRLVLIVSDGRSNANNAGLDDVAVRAARAGVVVSSVGESGERVLAQAADPATRVRPDASLQWLAEETGGMYLPDGVARRVITPRQDPFAYVRELIQTPSRPGPLMVQLTSAVRQRYRLTFPAPSDGRVHRLEVTVTAPGATAFWARRLMP